MKIKNVVINMSKYNRDRIIIAIFAIMCLVLTEIITTMPTKTEMKRRQMRLNKTNNRNKREVKTQSEIDKKIIYLDNKGNKKVVEK